MVPDAAPESWNSEPVMDGKKMPVRVAVMVLPVKSNLAMSGVWFSGVPLKVPEVMHSVPPVPPKTPAQSLPEIVAIRPPPGLREATGRCPPAPP
jgi:hypothetical protein